MKTNIVGIIIALILTFVGMLSVYAQDTKVSEVRKVDAFSSIEITSTYDFYTRFFLEHGIAMTADTEAATIDQILPMVRQNLGIGFIPEPLAQEVIEQGIVIQVPLLEEPPVREICFVEDKSSPHSMAANVLKEMLFRAGEKE